MIHFTCKKCGKTHSRSDGVGGTMIFCDCGQGITVPWESTASGPASPPLTASGPKVPDLAPIQFDPVTIPTPPSAAAPKYESAYPSTPPPPPPPLDEERPTRRGRTEKRDPDYCFNHQRRARAGACAECEEGFCADCLVKFQGELVCGPCKNFRARRQELPPVASSLANASLIISLIAGPLFMCFLLASPGNGAMRTLSWLSLMPQVLALGLGIWALRDAERERKGGGQWVALTGVGTASLTCILVLILNLAATRLASPG